MSLQTIEDAVRSANQAVLGPRPALDTGTATAVQLARGTAYQLVAASCAEAVANAAAVMTQTSVVCGAALATIIAKSMADPGNVVRYAPVIPQVEEIAAWSVEHFTKVSQAAASVASGYPAK